VQVPVYELILRVAETIIGIMKELKKMKQKILQREMSFLGKVLMRLEEKENERDVNMNLC